MYTDFGIANLHDYGLLNDPNLPASLTRSTKVAGRLNATSNEVNNDILAIFSKLAMRTAGLVDTNSRMVLAMSPASAVALGFVNNFGFVTRNMLFETAVQYSVQSTSDPQSVGVGNVIQLIAESGGG